MTKRYKLTLWVPELGNDTESLFYRTVEAEDTDDIQGIKEELAMEFERRLNTPVQCIAVKEIE